MSLLGGVLGSVVTGLLGKKSSDKAASVQAQSNQLAIEEQRRQFDATRADYQPFREAGVNALNTLADPNAFQSSPGYNFLRTEGMRGIQNTTAARGANKSGNALKALAEFQTGLAQQDYGNWWNRQAGLAGVGQQATNALGQFGAQSANNIGALMADTGAARASGVVGGANALSQGLSGAVDAWNYFRRPQMNTGGGWASGGAGRQPWMTPPIWQGPGSGQRYG